jgi:8-oxo-dGTP pyrophosphatase MutT (NUDIX family)
MKLDSLRPFLANRRRNEIRDPRLTPAAVLLLLYEINSTTHLLFTKRTEKVADHKGQISFPGGACDEGDESVETTALRETDEEVGVDRDTVIILGLLDDFLTVASSYVITPVVGIAPQRPQYQINCEEVAEIIEIPLLHFFDPAHCRRVSRSPEGEPIPESPEFQYGDHVIWGATARILEHFLSLLFPHV